MVLDHLGDSSFVGIMWAVGTARGSTERQDRPAASAQNTRYDGLLVVFCTRFAHIPNRICWRWKVGKVLNDRKGDAAARQLLLFSQRFRFGGRSSRLHVAQKQWRPGFESRLRPIRRK